MCVWLCVAVWVGLGCDSCRPLIKSGRPFHPFIQPQFNRLLSSPPFSAPNQKPHDSVRTLLEKASSTLGYLKMVTPRRRGAAANEAGAGREEEEEQDGDGGRVRLVYKNGEGLIDGEAEARERARYSNWDGGNLDPDAVRRHQHQLGRMGFRDNAHAKGVF